MNPLPDLLAHLQQLAASVGDGPTHLTDLVDVLVHDLRQTVTGYAGLTVTVRHAGHPVTFTAVVPGSIEAASTSLRLPLRLLSSSYEEGGQAVFYSTVPGALVDLAADLRYVLTPTCGGHDQPTLDEDLPPTSTTSGVTGLAELAIIYRATGVLLERGHDPDSLLEALRQQARAAGVAVHVVAAQLLAS